MTSSCSSIRAEIRGEREREKEGGGGSCALFQVSLLVCLFNRLGMEWLGKVFGLVFWFRDFEEEVSSRYFYDVNLLIKFEGFVSLDVEL